MILSHAKWKTVIDTGHKWGDLYSNRADPTLGSVLFSFLFFFFIIPPTVFLEFKVGSLPR